MRRALIYTVLIVVAILAGTYFALTRSGFARDLILDSLAKVLRVRLQLQDAQLDPLEGTVRLENLRLTPGKDDSGGRRRDVLQVPEVVVGVSMNPLSGPGEVRTLAIERPELDLYLGDPTPLDLASLFHVDDRAGAAGSTPSVRIRDMTVRLHLPSETDLVLKLGPIQLSMSPTTDGRIVLDGECPNPLGGMIKIRGGGDLEKEEFRLLADAEEFVLRADGMQTFGAGVARFVRERQLAGRVKPTLWLHYPDRNGAVAGGIRTTFTGFQVRPPAFTYLLTHLEGEASMTSEDNGTLEVRVDRSGTDLELSGAFRVSNIAGTDEVELRATARNIQINRKLREALAGIPAARTVYAAFVPDNGRGDLKIYVHSGIRAKPGTDGPVPRTQLDVVLRDVDMRYDGFPRAQGPPVGFPYPFRVKRAEVEVRDDFVTIRSVEGTGRAGGVIRGRGEVDLARDEIDLTIEVDRIPLGDELRRALATTLDDGGETLGQFAPSGNVDFDLRVFTPPGVTDTTWGLWIRPRGATATWNRFPYEVNNLVGEIRVSPELIDFHLRGNRRPGTSIEARARFANPGDPEQASTEIRIDAQDGVLDDELRRSLAALDPSFGEQWKLFSPRGGFDLEFLAWKPPGAAELDFDLRADLEDARARFEPFPVSLREINGPVVLHSSGRRTRVEIVGLRGRGLEARLLFRGSLEFPRGEAATPATDLTVVAKGVELQEELVDVLVEREFITREFWALAKAKGSVDAILDIGRTSGDADWRQELFVDLRRVTSEAEILPDVLTGMSGGVRIDNEHVIHLENLRGKLGDSPVTCDRGRIRQQNGDTLLELELSADRYPVDARLANLLDGEVKRAYLDRNARGQVSLAGFKIELRVPKVPPPGASGLGLSARFLGGEFSAHDLTLDMGLRVSDINGRVELVDGYFDHKGGRFEGRLLGLSFVALEQTFLDAQGPFIATHERVTIPVGQVQFHRGWIRSFTPDVPADGSAVPEPLLVFDFGDRRHLKINLGIADVSVERMLSGFQTLQHYRGLLDGQVRLELDTVDPTTLAMRASFGIKSGYLGDVPIFRSIYRLLRPEKRPNFESGLLVLTAKDRRLEIERLLVRSPLMRVEGKGSLRYDGYLELEIEFPNLFPEASPYIILPGIYRILANSLVSYDVTGYIGNLRTGARFVPFEDSPRQVPLAPIPGRPAQMPRIFR